MISFNWEHGGIVPPSLTPPPHLSSLLTAQRANLRRTLAPALTHCQTKTEVILFSLTHVSEAWGKSHHPWRTTEGVREIAAYFLPEHAAGIIDHAPLYPSIPSAVLMYSIREGPDTCRNVRVFFPICRPNQSAVGASRRDFRQVEQPWGRTTFPARPPLPYLIPADGVRWWPCQPVPLIFFFFFFLKVYPHAFTLLYWSATDLIVSPC